MPPSAKGFLDAEAALENRAHAGDLRAPSAEGQMQQPRLRQCRRNVQDADQPQLALGRERRQSNQEACAEAPGAKQTSPRGSQKRDDKLGEAAYGASSYHRERSGELTGELTHDSGRQTFQGATLCDAERPPRWEDRVACLVLAQDVAEEVSRGGKPLPDGQARAE